MRLLWRGLVGGVLVRRWRTHWLLIWGGGVIRFRRTSEARGGSRSVVRLRWYGSLLHLGGSDRGCLLPVAAHSAAIAFGATFRDRAAAAPLGAAGTLPWSAGGGARRLLTARNLRADRRRLETKLHRSLFCAI